MLDYITSIAFKRAFQICIQVLAHFIFPLLPLGKYIPDLSSSRRANIEKIKVIFDLVICGLQFIVGLGLHFSNKKDNMVEKKVEQLRRYLDEIAVTVNSGIFPWGYTSEDYSNWRNILTEYQFDKLEDILKSYKGESIETRIKADKKKVKDLKMLTKEEFKVKGEK